MQRPHLIRCLRSVQVAKEHFSEHPMGLVGLCAFGVLAYVWGWSEGGSFLGGMVVAAIGGPLAALILAVLVGLVGLIAEALADMLEHNGPHSS